MSSTLPRPFLHLAHANLAAQSAEQLGLAAVPLLAVMAYGAGAAETGLLAAVQTLPFLLLAMPLGLLADRMPRRRLMLRAEVLRALSLLLMLAVLAAPWSARMGIAGMALLGFIGAIGTVAFSVAAPALVPELVPREALARANGRIELARSAAFAAGPAVAGALVAWTGAAAAFVLAAALSAAAVALLWKLPEPARRMPAARHPWTELREGARFVLSHAWLRLMLLTGAIFNIAWFVLQAGYVPHAVRALGLGAQGVGLTLAMYGAGMVVGALLTPHIAARTSPGRAIRVGPFSAVLAAVLMASTLRWPSAGLAALSLFVFGAGPMVWTISSTTLRQGVTPAGMLGRVSAVFLTVNAGARPVGAALGAGAGALWGEAGCLLLALAGFVLQAAVIALAKLDAAPSEAALRSPT
ncbi:MFS transporter [Variovorax paradoxus]|jgi:predicted MFS family arabinose efflux permease|uniref:MFS transporter n=2 Tax=Variovorax paradoxus TaxID=34073 RepID=UPI0006E5A631|nr:MFS transporter [Variovorax paradoxus]KPV01705.1 MFS transporter [Variovorax paradoxus]KPV02449.1 MFS transporter [Variovorax paradoxus]KPV27695.1 MFS transporter [Variovorax paradoxus]